MRFWIIWLKLFSSSSAELLFSPPSRASCPFGRACDLFAYISDDKFEKGFFQCLFPAALQKKNLHQLWHSIT